MRHFFSSKLFVWIVVALVIGVVVYGIVLSGSPAKQRSLQFDQTRVSDLQQISFAVDEYWERNTQLPESLEDLRDQRYTYVRSATDPRTGELYEYRMVSEKSYELCAVFEKDSAEQQEQYPKPFSEQLWEHGIGHTCFSIEAHKLQTEPMPLPAR